MFFLCARCAQLARRVRRGGTRSRLAFVLVFLALNGYCENTAWPFGVPLVDAGGVGVVQKALARSGADLLKLDGLVGQIEGWRVYCEADDVVRFALGNNGDVLFALVGGRMRTLAAVMMAVRLLVVVVFALRVNDRSALLFDGGSVVGATNQSDAGGSGQSKMFHTISFFVERKSAGGFSTAQKQGDGKRFVALFFYYSQKMQRKL